MYKSKFEGNGRLSRCHVLFGKASNGSVKCHILINGIISLSTENYTKNKEELSTFNEEIQVTKLQDLCFPSCGLTIWATSKSI